MDPRSLGLRREVGRRLRVVRTSAGLSGPQLAARLPYGQSKVSRIETGSLWPPLADIRAWLEACDAPHEEYQRIMRLAEGVEGGITAIRELARGHLGVRQRELTEMDTQAAELCQFSPGMVSGLFHSDGYARACIAAASFGSVPGVEDAVAARLHRGERLRDPGTAPRVHLILLEAALRWVPAGGGVAATVATLRNLVATGQCPHITISVIPTGTPMPVLPQGSYMIVNWRDPDEPSIVIVETPAAEVTFTDEQEVADFRAAWNRVSSVALNPDDSVAFVAEIAEQLHAGTTL